MVLTIVAAMNVDAREFRAMRKRQSASERSIRHFPVLTHVGLSLTPKRLPLFKRREALGTEKCASQ